MKPGAPADLDRSIEAPIKDVPPSRWLPGSPTWGETVTIALAAAVVVDAVVIGVIGLVLSFNATWSAP